MVYVGWWLLCCWLGGVVLSVDGAPKCDSPPEGVQAPRSRLTDPKYKLLINTNPALYVPGEMYTVTLQGQKAGSVSAKFVGFSLVVESANPGGGNPGTFHLYGDATIQFSLACPNTVTHATPAPKSEVQVFWTAPPPGSGCVNFRATVVEHRDLWYQDDGPLTKTFCEDTQTAIEEQPTVNQQCCACDEAKYEVTFEGLWSRHTHPKDFPSNSSWVPRFSDVIGASHTTNYRFWDYGGIATEGLKQVAERGSTRMLESELKSQSQHIRTIIKARGISFPNVTGKTFAVFRVDNKHHLISLVSMIDPSPDWIVGVSGLELCMANCSWLTNKVIPLFPWDAGTDSGITYTSPDSPTEPRDHIRRITSTFPNDPRSPFYDPTGAEMKPLAMLYLTRQRLYEKSCSESNVEFNTNEACEVGEWSDWTSCSVSCGTGKRTRQRYYKNEHRAELNNCNKELTSRSTCYAQVQCRGNVPTYQPGGGVGGGGEVDEETDSLCAMTEWSSWSGCSVSCGQGERHRFRNLIVKRNWKKCMALPNPPSTTQHDICSGEDGPTCPQPEVAEAVTMSCEMTAWSQWSTCSVSCGDGVRKRVRKVANAGWEHEQRCTALKREEEMHCREKADCTTSPEEAKEICQLPKAEGKCRGILIEKWYFDSINLSCRKFSFTGCSGNRNQFNTKEECEEVCHELKEENTTPSLFGGIKPDSYLIPYLYTMAGPDGPVVDCRVSHWSTWSECSVTCGRGLKERTRHIIAHAKNGGRVCPKKLLKRRKCNQGPCNKGYDRDNSYNIDEDDDSSYKDDCIYTDWSAWSLCSATCGHNSVQQRTRAIDYAKTLSSAVCSERLQTRVCNVLPCRKN